MITDTGLQQKYLQEQKGRLSQGKIDTFLKENPNDYHRLKDVESDLQKPASQPAAAYPSPSPAQAGPTAEAPGGGTALSGLLGAAPQIGGLAPAGSTTATVSGVMEPEPGSFDYAGQLPLRQNLGTRMYPQESYILAGLRRAY